MERPVPRLRARLLAWRRRARSASSATASPAAPTCTSRRGRRPVASINFVTAHDGFTLRDLVCYNEKHNEANGEDNRDGDDAQPLVELRRRRPTDDPEINALRARQQRNFLATLLLSQGVPMLLGGDEIGRTQHGNNNAYCQDNELSWFDWADADAELFEFTRRLIAFRHAHPILRRKRFFQGRPIHGEEIATSSGSRSTARR